jgi:hypothetical protein
MSELSSSRDLHPDTGGRFVLERIDQALRYRVHVYLPAQRSWSGELDWVDGRARVVPEPAGDEELEWAHAELLKLARVLHRVPKPRLVRWRG